MALALQTMGGDFMLSSLNSIVLLLLGILASGNGFAHDNAEGVCPKYPNAKLQQIYIFDGKPEELVSLASDYPESDIYTLSAIYKEGRTVTIRCEYDTGFILDVELKKKVEMCKGSENKAGVPKLVCK
jgi:hypothetical protein